MASNPLSRLAQQGDSDRVLIILQLHGGNDGLNSLIPVEAYDLYYSRRANIAIPKSNSVRRYIPLDSTLPSDAQVGLHPDMQAMKALYDHGKMAFVQGVSYKNNNGSHFRGRDIWFMGGGSDDYFSSGWVGRYLQQEYAPLQYPEDFPNEEINMLDPLGIEMGSDVSLIFHQEGNIPTSLSLNDPVAFANLVEELEGFQDKDIDPRGKVPDFLNNSPYGKEMNWILGLEKKSDDYAKRLYEVYQAGGNTSVTYPEVYPFNAPTGSKRNHLSPQLKLIARLLAGGCKTKVFMVKIGGFDTHASQVESYDPTMGIHAALMYHISTAMKAFQDDLKARGLEDRVLTVTTSEFGRRVHSNGSYGTDHGTGGPIFVFGRGVKPGVVGKVPDMTRDNIEMQYDYRQVFTSVVKDWFAADEGAIAASQFGDWVDDRLPIIGNGITSSREAFLKDRFHLKDCYPNPVKENVTFGFMLNTPSKVVLRIIDMGGKEVKVIESDIKTAGEHSISANLKDLKTGTYIYEINAGTFKESKKLVKM